MPNALVATSTRALYVSKARCGGHQHPGLVRLEGTLRTVTRRGIPPRVVARDRIALGSESVRHRLDPFARGAVHDRASSRSHITQLEAVEFVLQRVHAVVVFLEAPDNEREVLPGKACRHLLGLSHAETLDDLGQGSGGSGRRQRDHRNVDALA
jgi:hypothetical protein